MKINAENQLLAIDETCLSELSEENESTISGGFFLLKILGGFLGYPKSQPTTTTVINNIYVVSSSGAVSSSGGSTGGGGYYPKP